MTAAVAVASHALLWVEGPEAVSFLDGQVSQDVAAMAPGEVRRSFLLEPRGKLQAILWVLRGEDAVGLVMPGADLAAVSEALERFRFRVKATLRADAQAGHSVWGTYPAGSGWSEADGVITVVTPAGWSVVFAAEPPPGERLDAAGLDAARIAAAEPWFGVDVDDGTIPQETGLVPAAVSFSKGCYLGQELVARIDSRGHVNRHLRRLVGTGAAPEAGAEVRRDDTVVGSATTVAVAPGGWRALAMLRREAAPGDAVSVAGSTATVEEAVPSQISNSGAA